MYAIKENQTRRFFGSLERAKKYQKKQQEKNIILDIYKQKEDKKTGYIYFEKLILRKIK